MDRFWSAPLAVPQADICICAGDVSSDLKTSLDYLAEIAREMPVVATLGNHEYYGHSIDQALEAAEIATRGTDVHILENRSIELSGVKFLGATLWTDFEIVTGKHDEDLPASERLANARQNIRQHSPDFSEIYSDELRGGMVDMDELRNRHEESRAFIVAELERTPYAQKSVVISHHAPLTESLDVRFDGRPSNAGYASDLSAVIVAGKPSYWIHGHIHRHVNYVHDHTRVINNPRGFSNERERNGFQPSFVIEL
ncbi:metallophosphoesterase [Rhizobium leguminosarum]|uniref:metallophosphoesterase n=1 Tax=Rhizobium leguminosarum TaxID=384 RepID=UPI001FE00BD8|nr:metallophosphoesterase [Rhizobium leguminosarum]